MKNKTLALTIGSIILGAGVAIGTTAYAGHGHGQTGNTTAMGGGMMGSAPQTPEKTWNGHMGSGPQIDKKNVGGHMGHDKAGLKQTPITTAENHHDTMHGSGNRQNHMGEYTGNIQNHMTGNTPDHMSGDAGKTANQHHGTADHHNSKPAR